MMLSFDQHSAVLVHCARGARVPVCDVSSGGERRQDVWGDECRLRHRASLRPEAEAATAASALIAIRFLNPIGSRSTGGTWGAPTAISRLRRILRLATAGARAEVARASRARIPGVLLIGPPGGPRALCRILGQR